MNEAQSKAWVAVPRRPLPRPVVPMLNETIESYLARLAEANRLDPDALRIHITGQKAKSARVPVSALALLSGQPERSLRYAILELNTPAERAKLHTANRPSIEAPSRPACKLCALAHPGRREPWCRNRHEDVVCLRHRRWLGDGADNANTGQPDLTYQPIIVRANLTHRRLIRDHGRAAATEAVDVARHICHRWYDRGEHEDQFFELIRVFFPGRSQVAAADPAVHAAIYPQIVAVARLLVSPHWRGKAHEDWPDPKAFIRELRRTAAPRFYWSLEYPRGPRDPLIKVLLEDRVRREITGPAVPGTEAALSGSPSRTHSRSASPPVTDSPPTTSATEQPETRGTKPS